MIRPHFYYNIADGLRSMSNHIICCHEAIDIRVGLEVLNVEMQFMEAIFTPLSHILLYHGTCWQTGAWFVQILLGCPPNRPLYAQAQLVYIEGLGDVVISTDF